MKNSILLLFTFFLLSTQGYSSPENHSSIFYENAGCTDSSACNYDCQATVDDGSCEFSCYGCTDSTALNFDQTATIDDGSCEEPACFNWSYCYENNETSGFLFTSNSMHEIISLSFNSGETEASYDFIYFYDGVNNNAPLIAGPVDGELTGLSFQSTGQNLFVEIITDNIISCQENSFISQISATYCNVFVTIVGCTDNTSSNYNSEANLDDGSCQYFDCDSSESVDWTNQDTDVYPNGITLNLGSEISMASVINLNNTWFNENDGNSYNVAGFELQSVTGLPEGINQTFVNGVLPIGAENGSQICLPLNGLIYPIGLYEVEYSGTIIVLLGQIEIELPAVFYQTIEVIWDGLDILGCTYPGANNYNFVATLDNSQCVFTGCTDPTAINYSAHANLDTGSCLYSENICSSGLIWDEELQTCVNPNQICPGDLDENGFVTSSDLSIFLSVFGNECE